MAKEIQCALCQHMKIKNKFFGGKKYLCAIRNCEVGIMDSCSQFIADADKILQRARFRPHEFGSSNSCHTCAHNNSQHENMQLIYICKKHNVQFWKKFNPMEHICDDFKDGGMDTLINHLASLIIEEKNFKKRGE